MENAVGALAQHNRGLKCLSLCGTPAYSPGWSVMDLSRAVMQISALVFIPLCRSRTFLCSRTNYVLQSAVSWTPHICGSQSWHWFNTGDFFFLPLFRLCVCLFFCRLTKIAMVVKTSRHSIHAPLICAGKVTDVNVCPCSCGLLCKVFVPNTEPMVHFVFSCVFPDGSQDWRPAQHEQLLPGHRPLPLWLWRPETYTRQWR